jgi:hypothetical protein
MNRVTQQIAKYGYLIVIMALYVFAISKSEYTRGIIKNGRIQFGGDSMKHQIGMSLLVGLSILALVLSFNSLNLMSIVFILAVILVGYVITGELLISIAVAIIFGSVVVSYSTTSDYTYTSVEGFEEKKENATHDTAKKEDNKDKSATPETKDTKKESDKATTTKKVSDAGESASDADIDVDETFQFDQKSSVLDLYNSLSEDQIKGMKKDTKELMETQQQLIKTLNEMGPTLKQSKEILASFQNYFGDENEMNKKLTDLKTAKL